MTEQLHKLSAQAATIIRSLPQTTRIRVISHYDADGITAAAILFQALYRAGYDVHVSLMRNPFTKGLERVKQEENELVIFADMGSGQLNIIEQFSGKSIIIDHHQVLAKKTSKNILQINANLCGINGSYEACGSSLSFAVAKTLDAQNIDLAPLALAGMVGDKQYIGGIRGYNKTVADEAVQHDIVTEKIDIKLYGSSLENALYYAIDPYYSGISGNKQEIRDILQRLDLPGNVPPDALSQNQQRTLHSYLLLTLIKKDCQHNILDTVIRPRYWSDIVYGETERFADLLDACGKGGKRGLGLRICLGDADALKEALQHEQEYKHKILQSLTALEQEGVKKKKNIRYFYATDSSLGGVIGGIAMNYILGSEKPLLSLVRSDDELHVSSRATQYLVQKGLDLGAAMKEAATALAGHGGGHAIAAGATIDAQHEEAFLGHVDTIIGKQLKR